MGRFYRTASASPLDYMYSINTPLMEKAVMANDQGITNTQADFDKVYSAGTFGHLDIDKAAAEQEQQNIENKALEFSKAMQADPANWRKQLPALRQYKQELLKNYTSGPISKYTSNFSQAQKDFTEADKQAELWHTSGGKKGVDPEKAKLWKQYTLNNFKGTKNPDGTYNTFSSNPLYDNIDIPAKLQDVMSKIVKDKNTTAFTQDSGAVWNDVKQSWEGINPDKLRQIATSTIMNDPMIMKSLSQDSDIGYTSGIKHTQDKIDPTTGEVIAKKGDFRTPYREIYRDKQNPFTPEENQILLKEQNKINLLKKTNPQEAEIAQAKFEKEKQDIINKPNIQWDNGSYLAPIMQSAIQQYSGITSDNESKSRIDPIYQQERQIGATRDNLLLSNKFQNARQQAGFNFQAGEAEKKHGWDMEMQQARLDAAAAKANSGKGSKSTDEKTTTTPTLLGYKEATPFAYLGTTPDEVATNLQGSIKENVKTFEDLKAKRDKFIADGDIDMADYVTNQMANVKNNQFTLGARNAKAKDDAHDVVLNGIPEKDKQLYNNEEKVKQDLLQAQKRINNFNRLSSTDKYKIIQGLDSGHIHALQNIEDTPEYKNFNRLKEIKNKIDSTYKDNLLKATKETTNGTPQIETTVEDDKFLRKSMSMSPSAFKVIDPQTGKEDNTFSFEAGFDPENKDMHIVSTGPANGLGANNMPILVKIKNAKGIMVNRQIVPVGPTAQIVKNHFVNSWSKTKDPQIRQLTSTITSPFNQPISNLITSISQGNSGIGDVGASKFTSIDLPTGRADISITPTNTGYKVETKMADGSWRKLPNPNGGTLFTSDTDIINSLEQIKDKLTPKK